jgi:hypothetical protein
MQEPVGCMIAAISIARLQDETVMPIARSVFRSLKASLFGPVQRLTNGDPNKQRQSGRACSACRLTAHKSKDCYPIGKHSLSYRDSIAH